MYIKRNTIKKMLKDAGAERVSDEAVAVLYTNMNKMVFSFASRTAKLAKHAKRKTIIGSDVKLAMHTQ